VDPAERRHETGIVLMTLGVAALTVLWWIGVAQADAWVRSHHDLSDATLGSHMGSDATDFRYDLAWAVLVTLPVFVLSAWHAIRRGYLDLYLGAIGLLWFASTIVFVLGARGCTSGPAYSAAARWYEDAAIAIAVSACLIGGALVGRRVVAALGVAASMAVALGASTALIGFVQWDNCAGASWQVVRSWDILMAPIFAIVALPLLWIGMLIGRAAGTDS
jgi:hypothetical protein